MTTLVVVRQRSGQIKDLVSREFDAVRHLLDKLHPFIKIITDYGKNIFELLFIMDYRPPELIN